MKNTEKDIILNVMKNYFTEWKGAFLFPIITFILVLLRIPISETILFGFLIWNLFLAYIPWCIGLALKNYKKINLLSLLTLLIWLLFYPNTWYLITDLVHLQERGSDHVYWYDLAMLFLVSYFGIMYGYKSLKDVGTYLSLHINNLSIEIAIQIIILASSFGIYLGRFLRWNSWDIVTNPLSLLKESLELIIHPSSFISDWFFILGTYLLINICYFGLNKK